MYMQHNCGLHEILSIEHILCCTGVALAISISAAQNQYSKLKSHSTHLVL